MRDFKGIKRQRNRNRNGGGGGGGGKPQHNANRAFDSNGPDGMKVRGAAQHVYEKYQQLARDAHTSGDRVLCENLLQHAEHYFRVLRAMQPQRPLADIVGREQFISGYDIDFEDESVPTEAAEPESEPAEGETDRPDQRPAEDRGYRGEQRPREEWRGEDRYDRGQANRGGDRSDRQFRGPRDDRYRDDRQRGGRDERPRFERDERPERGDGRNGSPFRGEDQEYRSPPAIEPERAAPAPMLRADDGEVSHAPAFLQTRPVESRDDATGEARRPRRRRSGRDFNDGEPARAPTEADDN